MIISFFTPERSTKSFRIYDSWLSNEDFISLAKEGINTPLCGNGLFRPQQKLKRIKALAKIWSAKLGNSAKQVEQARKDLDKEALLLIKDLHFVLLQEKVRVLQVN